MPARFALLLAALACLALPSAAADSWVGEVVLLRYDLKLQPRATPVGSNCQVPFSPKYLNNRVRKDRGDEILIRDRDKDLWIPKRWFVRPADAVEYANESLKFKPNDPDAFHFRAIAHKHLGDFDAALKDVDRAFRVFPNSTRYRFTRAGIYAAKGDLDQAIHDYDVGIGFDPTNDVAIANRGMAWLAKKEFDRAHRDFTEALRFDPKCPDPLIHRAETARRTGRYLPCVLDLDAALRLDEGHPEAMTDKAWLLATCPDESIRDGKKAVELAIRACRSTGWKSGPHLITLAVAHAENNNFEKAENCVRAALDDDKQWAARNRQVAEAMLELFAEKQPLRESPPKK